MEDRQWCHYSHCWADHKLAQNTPNVTIIPGEAIESIRKEVFEEIATLVRAYYMNPANKKNEWDKGYDRALDNILGKLDVKIKGSA